MGFSGSWLAIKNKSADLVISELELNRTGQFIEIPDEPIVATQLDTGWYLIVTDQVDHNFTQYETLSNLSIDCEVISCAIEEHVMVSTAEYWQDGSVIWSIQHDAEESLTNLTTSGEMPKIFKSVYQALTEKHKQDSGNGMTIDYYFDIPLETAHKIVGFKHDESELGEDAFEVLESKPKPNKISINQNTEAQVDSVKPWWQFW